jgi:hypothetical protein
LTTVFISGSRRIRRLSVEVRERLDRIVEKRPPVVPEKAFSEVRSRGDFDALAHRLGDAAARRLRDRALHEGLFETEEEQAPLRL